MDCVCHPVSALWARGGRLSRCAEAPPLTEPRSELWCRLAAPALGTKCRCWAPALVGGVGAVDEVRNITERSHWHDLQQGHIISGGSDGSFEGRTVVMTALGHWPGPSLPARPSARVRCSAGHLFGAMRMFILQGPHHHGPSTASPPPRATPGRLLSGA